MILQRENCRNKFSNKWLLLTEPAAEPRRYKMKNKLYILSIFILTLSGCLWSGLYNKFSYSVEFRNIGTKDIRVRELYLTLPQDSSKVRSFELLHGQGTSLSSYNQEPDKVIALEWVDIESKETSNADVKIQLPILFKNPEYPSSIIFYINSDNKKVQVAYRVFSQAKSDFIKVDSEGKPFALTK